MKLGANDSKLESPTTITRTHTRTAKLSKSGHVKVRDFLIKQGKLYKAELEERIDCYKKTGNSISLYDQCKSLTEVRADDPDYGEYSVHALRSCLLRLDKSFKNFFNMTKSHKLARSTLERGWGKFANMLAYKAESPDSKVTRVNPKTTSRTYSVCSKGKTEMSLSERVYSCSRCGLRIDLDVNAAINISRIAARSGGNIPGDLGDIEIERRGDLHRRGNTSRAQNSLPKSHYGQISGREWLSLACLN